MSEPTSPEVQLIDGRPNWVWPDGKTLPVVSGGSEDIDGGDTGGDSQQASEEEAGDEATEQAERLKQLDADAKKWKAIALKHEQTAKANVEAAEKLKEMELAGKSETEKLQTLLEEARAEARTARVQALRHQVAAEKGLPASLAKFLPDIDNEVDMTAAADELLEAAGADPGKPPPRQPKSNLLNPLHDDEDRSRDQLLAAMQGRTS